jgi:hypothetical protein
MATPESANRRKWWLALLGAACLLALISSATPASPQSRQALRDTECGSFQLGGTLKPVRVKIAKLGRHPRISTWRRW